VLRCIVTGRTVLWCTCSGEDSALVHIKWRGQCSSSDIAKSIVLHYHSAPLQIKWNADTPMFFALDDLVRRTVLCVYMCSREHSAPVQM